MTLLRTVKQFLRCDSGATLLEAAVVLPVAVVFMVGIADFGLAYGRLATAQKSLRNAARYLSILPQQAVCTWGRTNARNLAIYGNIQGTGTAVIPGWTAAAITFNTPTNCATAPVVIKLTATVPYNAMMWQVVGLPDGITMTTSHEQRWIGE